MTVPPEPPPTPPPPDPGTPPPDPGTPPPDPGGPPPPEPKGDLASQLATVTRQLDKERRDRARAEQRLSQIDAASQTEAERAAAKAREEGKAEGLKAGGARLAAAEFRARAAAKGLDPSAIIKYFDMALFVADDGEPDLAAIDAAVGDMPAPSGTPPRPVAPKVPNGVQPEPAEGDWLRSAVMRGGS